jgi:hypothetical protein
VISKSLALVWCGALAYRGREMLRFPCPLTAAATEIFILCLEISADVVVDFDPPDAWRDMYPLSATCFTPELARETLLDLVAKLRLPEAYVPTEYHWLLMYECLQALVEVLNDDPLPSLVAQLTPLVTAQDALYLSLPTRRKGGAGFHIDFDALVDTYFWDTDFLLDAESFSQLDADAKASLGFSPSVFGVVQGLSPHPDELVLRRSEEYEPTSEREQEED